MSYVCTIREARSVQAWLLRLARAGLAFESDECPICFDDEGTTLQLNCGHKYHTACFEGLAQDSFEDAKVIKCCGTSPGGDVCDHIVTVTEVRKWLPSAAIEQKLEQAVTIYVNSHSEEYGYCATPDCGTIFAVTSDPAINVALLIQSSNVSIALTFTPG
ncbi:hypothetical protein LTS07_002023 [Exophiala sideris]|uniref:RING-type domain-containing protein n=1 Tax=Exophiala sideris TaxID=1016849 RepID=A0ABR0JL12_9EURO|nr:hypothetical protein LTR13_007517 [Exophiala sideris]KAK5036297.1 hypothetical protein LTS07_002023 [Exophiala sideris]KAK5066680.1 hypothetical protein LTR69_002027 [Exophiala sideris]KAK5180502.1 hypothetical protein LTR44_007260 [Eurotiomycetes sp. CCFEE 6388]